MSTTTKIPQLPFIKSGVVIYWISVAISLVSVLLGDPYRHPLMHFTSTLLLLLIGAMLVVGNTDAFKLSVEATSKHKPLPMVIHRLLVIMIVVVGGLLLMLPMIIWPNNFGATVSLIAVSYVPVTATLRKLVKK